MAGTRNVLALLSGVEIHNVTHELRMRIYEIQQRCAFRTRTPNGATPFLMQLTNASRGRRDSRLKLGHEVTQQSFSVMSLGYWLRGWRIWIPRPCFEPKILALEGIVDIDYLKSRPLEGPRQRLWAKI